MKDVTAKDIETIMCHYGEAFCDITGIDHGWFGHFEKHFEQNNAEVYAAWRKEWEDYVARLNNPDFLDDESRAERFDCELSEHLCSSEKYYQAVADFANSPTGVNAKDNLLGMVESITPSEVSQEEIDEEKEEFVKYIQSCETFDLDSLAWISRNAKSLKEKIEKKMEQENG